jgi:flap endonuclease-1
MGILGLAKLIADIAPMAVKESEIKHYFGMYDRGIVFMFLNVKRVWIMIICIYYLGRKVAIDASMSLYQFLIAVRNEGAQLTSVDGETTR